MRAIVGRNFDRSSDQQAVQRGGRLFTAQNRKLAADRQHNWPVCVGRAQLDRFATGHAQDQRF